MLQTLIAVLTGQETPAQRLARTLEAISASIDLRTAQDALATQRAEQARLASAQAEADLIFRRTTRHRG